MKVTVKKFKTEKSMKAAIRKAGLHLMNYEVHKVADGLCPQFMCHTAEDAAYLRSSGWMACVNPTKAAGD